MSANKTVIELSCDEALVLLAWLVRFNENAGGDFQDQAEERVLWDLEAILESKLAAPLASDYLTQLADARNRVRDSTE